MDEQGRDSPPLVASTLFVAVLRGLLLDELVTGETGRTEQAMQRFVGLIDCL
jgi:hypothetical protein